MIVIINFILKAVTKQAITLKELNTLEIGDFVTLSPSIDKFGGLQKLLKVKTRGNKHGERDILFEYSLTSQNHKFNGKAKVLKFINLAVKHGKF